jgi:phosphohistidine phosphatase
MKRLILIRHASALPEQFPQRDFDRSLSDVGLQEAQSLAAYLLVSKHLPDFLMFSPAQRTQTTARIIREAFLSETFSMQANPLLYNAGFQTIQNQLRKLKENHHTVAFVGHNPGISQLATVLSADFPYQFPPAGCLCLEFPAASWGEIENGSGKEIWYYCP